MPAFSTCWNTARHQNGQSLIQQIRNLGFHQVEVSHGLNLSLLPGIMDAVKNREITVTGIHNFCPSPVEVALDAPDIYEFTSPNSIERQRALDASLRSLETGTRLGAKYLVLHLGGIPMKNPTQMLFELAARYGVYSRKYVRAKMDFLTQRARASSPYLDRARDAISKLLDSAKSMKIQLGIEGRSHVEQIPSEPEVMELLEDFKDEPMVGYWHDFGHIQRKANLTFVDHAQCLAKVSHRLIGAHVHDVEYPKKDHRVPLSIPTKNGGVDFDHLLSLIPDDRSLVWELSPGVRSQEIRDGLIKWNQRFPHR